MVATTIGNSHHNNISWSLHSLHPPPCLLLAIGGRIGRMEGQRMGLDGESKDWTDVCLSQEMLTVPGARLQVALQSPQPYISILVSPPPHHINYEH